MNALRVWLIHRLGGVDQPQPPQPPTWRVMREYTGTSPTGVPTYVYRGSWNEPA